jgi:hypothetical protein
MRTILRLIQSSHAQGTDVACPVIARRNRVVHHRGRADEADFCFNVLRTSPLLILLLPS